MKLKDGKYVVLFDDGEGLYTVGTFEIQGHKITVLDDEHGTLAKLIPTGEITPAHLHRMRSIMRNGYYHIEPAHMVTEE